MINILFTSKRIGLGLLTMIGLAIILGFIPNPPNPFSGSNSPVGFNFFVPWNAFWTTLRVAIYACAGAYIARVYFAAAAALLIAAGWLYAVRVLYLIGEPFYTFVELLGRSFLSIVVAILGAVIGAEVGLWLARRNMDCGSVVA